MLHNMVAPLAPMQLSNARQARSRNQPKGLAYNPLATSPKGTQTLAASALSISAPSTPENRETSLVLAFFFPCWLEDGGHNTNTTLADSRLYIAWQEGIQESGQGRGKVQRPLYFDITNTAAATGLAGLAVLCSVICCL